MPIPENIVQRAANCTIRQFMQCSFDGKLKVLILEGEASDEDLRAAFEYIYAEYVDFSDLYQSQEFEMVAYINSLDTRIQVVKRFVDLQRKFLAQFGMPYLPGFEMVKRYGHHIYWDAHYPDKDVFLKKLSQIELKEKKYETKVSQKVTELLELRKKKVKKEHTILESRKDFVTMLNRLQQARFNIDKDKTSVEELALMIKDQRDQIEETKMQNKIKKMRG
jgi:hypothetical protein